MDEIKKLGFGLMRLPMKGDEIDMEQVNAMVDSFLAQGFTYFDSAYVYHGGKSEVVIKEAIVKRHPRDSFTIATKLPIWEVKTKEDVDRIFQEQLERTGAGYFDYYLMHAIDATRIGPYGDEFGCWDYALKKKAEGTIKHLGFSFHDSADVLDKALTRFPEADFVQLQINYADWDDSAVQAGKCYEVARKHGKSIVVMEPVKGGSLAQLHPDVQKVFREADPKASMASWAVRYVASLPGVLTVLSGMSTLEQMQDNTSYMSDFKPMTDEEKAVVAKAVTVLKAIPTIPCTSCRYCVDGCPQKILIPGVFNAMNFHTMYGDKNGASFRYKNDAVGQDHGKASDCIHCGQCEDQCPQHLEITRLLEEAAKLFD